MISCKDGNHPSEFRDFRSRSPVETVRTISLHPKKIVKDIDMESIDLESIPSQIGTGIIRINDQTIIKVRFS
jgi:hypothetical protein